ncbi:VWA domain-containing protein [Steroidobacter flavus]|uniref:VWA domain-containing protein n=1 Tax=Steroidobacter flavus TaxID=1842136 RepID=A0ABV8SMM0_9GAMM
MSLDDEAARRWRLILGGDSADGIGCSLNLSDGRMDRALQALYDSDRKGGLGSSAPNVSRWLGDIREYFPTSVVQVLQRDAIERLDMTRLLMEPEVLESLKPDVHLIADLIAMSGMIPAKTRETARQVVRKVVNELLAKLSEPTRQSVQGALNRAARNRRPRHNDIDWPRTIRANLKNYQPDYQTVIPEVRFGYGRRRQSMRHIILCIDQSGSMAASVVYSAIFGAVLATLPSVITSLVVFDTAVIDLTEELEDPIDLLFSVRLGGGTDINGAVGYCQQLVRSPQDTVFVLISDLYEGGVETEFMRRATNMVASGMQFVTLLALSDEGAPAYNADLAGRLATLGVPAFACTPDKFPALMAAAIERRDLREFVEMRK